MHDATMWITHDPEDWIEHPHKVESETVDADLRMAVRARRSRLRGARARECGESSPPMPELRGNSRRVISTFAIHSGAPIMTASERADAASVDVTSLKVPSFARPCAMVISRLALCRAIDGPRP